MNKEVKVCSKKLHTSNCEACKWDQFLDQNEFVNKDLRGESNEL